MASGNDASQKLAKPLPGVAWDSDDLAYEVNLNGTMYFLDYRDYKVCKNRIRKDFIAQGWKQNRAASDKAGIAIMTYIPSRDGYNALFNDDPVDAAGMAMMVSAMQNVTLQSTRLYANVNNDMFQYAEASAKLEARQAIAAKRHPTLSKIGSFGSDIGAGLEAMGANMNSGMVAKWATAGHPVELLVENSVVARSVRGVLVSARLTEKSYVIDDTSGDEIYPTAMDVDISVKNMYGSLITTSSGG